MEFKIKNVLVLANFSDCSNNAIQLAVAIAQRQGATLHLLHAMNQPLLGRVAVAENKIFDVTQRVTDEARSKLWLCAEVIVANSLLRVKTHLISDNLIHALPKFEKEKQINLTIVGTRGSKGIRDVLSESMAMQVIKASTCATMAVPAEYDKNNFESLLFPIRDVVGVEQKYKFLEPIIKTNNPALHLLGVYSVSHDSEVFPVTDRLKALHDTLRDYPNKITYEVISSASLPNTVLEIGSKRKSDLIVINATLDEKWYWLLTGRSYTHQLVSKSTCPILCIKPQLIAINESDDEDLFSDSLGYLPMAYNLNGNYNFVNR